MMDYLEDCDTTDACDLEVINLNSITDEKLRSATLESLETGKITPLLKEELKCRILTRCLEEGKELSPDRSGTKITPRRDKMKPDEMVRLERRREQNRRAARKFRMKKQNTTHKLQKESSLLENKNKELRDDIQNLMKEKYYLQNLLNSHSCCSNRSPTPDLSPLVEFPVHP